MRRPQKAADRIDMLLCLQSPSVHLVCQCARLAFGTIANQHDICVKVCTRFTSPILQGISARYQRTHVQSCIVHACYHMITHFEEATYSEFPTLHNTKSFSHSDWLPSIACGRILHSSCLCLGLPGVPFVPHAMPS